MHSTGNPSTENLPSAPLPKLRFLTGNLAMLPRHLAWNNSDNLNPNLYRAREIARQIIEGNYDVVCMEEVWDPGAVDLLKELLGPTYKFISAGINEEILTYPNPFLISRNLFGGKDNELYEGESLWEKAQIKVVRGGLMIVSKLEFVDRKDASYDNEAMSEELMAQKGYKARKVRVGKDHFATFIVTHMHANGKPVWPAASEWWGGTFSHRRGEQCAKIYKDLVADEDLPWHKQPPPGTQLRHLDTFFCADLNRTANFERMFDGVSIGGSNNGFDVGDIKYTGAFDLGSACEFVPPQNFQNVLKASPERRGEHKMIDGMLLAEAIENGKLTGTDILNGIKVPTNNLDVVTIFRNPESTMGEFKTTIVSFKDPDTSRDLSDHRFISADYDPNKPRIEYPTEYTYDAYKHVATTKVDPSAGWPERFFMRPKVTRLVPRGPLPPAHLSTDTQGPHDHSKDAVSESSSSSSDNDQRPLRRPN